jgi:hypothetical protein
VLGVAGEEQLLAFDAEQRRVQVAVDGLSLRHQVAKALARFLHARAVAAPDGGAARSIWLTIADSPRNIVDVVSMAATALKHEPTLFANVFLPPGTLSKDPPTPQWKPRSRG